MVCEVPRHDERQRADGKWVIACNATRATPRAASLVACDLPVDKGPAPKIH